MSQGRPIILDCGSENYRIAEYLDYYLNPLSTKHNSYIKDTYDCVEKIKKATLDTNTFLFSIDVKDLYTNIETHWGLEAIKQIFHQNPDAHRLDDNLLELLK